ncbi:MAG: formate dehydrogenase accessory sulfurtransferase FdhD [Chloroflexota bacterium]|nr:formate dehydrogenase accessory sulfurtransferase FdhD [Chloroflexota bacterium]
MEPVSAAQSVSRRSVLAVDGDQALERDEALAGEEPLELRACGPGQEPVSVAVTMRTPGDEEVLAAGFLVTEGLVAPALLAGARFHPGDPAAMALPENEVTVHLAQPFDAAAVPGRNFVATASCGICGKASVDDVVLRCEPLPDGPTVRGATLLSMPGEMRRAQDVFASTGGLHAAALFSPEGQLRALREDVGRHNALDKLIGTMALAGELPLHDSALLVSGRISFEIVQKAAMAGLAVLAAVSAPTDLAVSTADRLGMTLVGFLRGERFNIYAGRERIDLSR